MLEDVHLLTVSQGVIKMLNTEQILSVYGKLEKAGRVWGSPTWREGLQESILKALDKSFENENACKRFLTKAARDWEIDQQRRNSTFCNKVFNSVKSEILDNDGTLIFHIKSAVSERLTARQVEILEMVLSGYRAVEIAALLEVSKAAISQSLKKIVSILRDYDLVEGLELMSYPVNRPGYSEDEMIFFLDRELEKEREAA
jgi:predicted DNA-binding protein YlxM (UPF0122 family)